MYRIGIDIDDTITNTTEKILEYAKKLDLFDNVSNVDLVNFDDSNLEKYREFLEKYIDKVLDSCTLKENASYVINSLKSEGNKIYIITARSNNFSKNVKDITTKFLERNNIPYDEIFFNNETKKEICEKKKIDYMIDDNIRVYNSLIGTKTKPILFSKELTKDMEADKVDNWLDIIDLFRGDYNDK